MTRTGFYYTKKLIFVFVVTIILFSVTVFSKNPPPLSVAYADMNNSVLDNQSLINYISDQLVGLNIGSSKLAVQKVLAEVQMQIIQTAGQNEAAKIFSQLSSLITSDPTGPFPQYLLSLANQEQIGSEDVVKQGI